MDCWAIIIVQGFLQPFWWRYSFMFLRRRDLPLQLVIVMCGYLCSPTPFQTCDNHVWLIDVSEDWRKENLGKQWGNGIIVESAITISHSTRLVSFFVCLSFKLQIFSEIISVFYYYYYFELTSVIRYQQYGPIVTYLMTIESFFFFFFLSTLDVFSRHDCDASIPVKLNYLTIFCSLVFEHHFLAFHFLWAAWFLQL